MVDWDGDEGGVEGLLYSTILAQYFMCSFPLSPILILWTLVWGSNQNIHLTIISWAFSMLLYLQNYYILNNYIKFLPEDRALQKHAVCLVTAAAFKLSLL